MAMRIHIRYLKSQPHAFLCIQMDSLVDVGAPAYGQLQKLKGQSLDTADMPNEKVNVSTHYITEILFINSSL